MNWLQGLATTNGMSYFFAGFFLAYVFYFFWCKHKKRAWHVNWRYAGIAIGISVMFFVTLQTQAAYSLAAETSVEVKECQREFNQALKSRALISEDNDRWSAIQRKAIGDWLFEIIVPPPRIQEIRATDPNFSNNPEYIKWGLGVTTKYSNIVQKAQKEQDENFEERKGHPLPEPTCGK
jgi:hypothetical protein